jgi:AcrR family transcriptional regulator
MSEKKARRFQHNDWLDLGLTSISDEPITRLTVDLLCHKASKTKGSFYFHFKNIDAYFVALAEHWYEQFTIKLIRHSQQKSTPKSRMDLLNVLAIQLDPRIELGMRALSVRVPAISEICQKADEKRLNYLSQLYQSTGHFNGDDANALATFEYAAMVGYQQIKPEATPKETAAMYQVFLNLTGRG